MFNRNAAPVEANLNHVHFWFRQLSYVKKKEQNNGIYATLAYSLRLIYIRPSTQVASRNDATANQKRQ